MHPNLDLPNSRWTGQGRGERQPLRNRKPVLWLACGMLCWLLLGMTGQSARTCHAQSPAYGGDPGFSGTLPWDSRHQFYEQLPADRGGVYEEVSPVDRFLRQVGEQSWIQIDYMLWNLDQSDNGVIGESVQDVDNPAGGYLAFDRGGTPPTTDQGATRLGYAPTADMIDLNSMNGMRLKYGLEMREGTFEASTWWIFQANRHGDQGPFVTRNDPLSNIPLPPTVDPDGVTAIPLLRDSEIANSALIFDTAYSVDYEASMFGAEFNYLWDDHRRTNGFRLRPLLGFRYIKLDETMKQTGVNRETTEDEDDNEVEYFNTATITANTINQLFGPQIGFQAELVDDRFTLGARPAFMLAVNRLDSSVATNDLFQGDNPLTPDTDESTVSTYDSVSENQAAPVVSLALYSKIRLFKNWQLYVSYDLQYLDGIARPSKNTVYEDDGDSTPDFFTDPQHDSMLIQGLSVGSIFEF